jgi:hypothetical protein
LLAPALLNVRPSIAAYASLHRIAPELNRVLKEIPTDASLLESDNLEMIGRLYAPLDEHPRPFGV